jgi:hypothetical protein
MNASFQEIGHEMFYGSVSLVVSILRILIPVMIIVELLLAYKVIDRIAPRLTWLTKLLGVSKEALLPMLVGLFIGVTYSAGTLMEINKQRPLSKKDFTLIAIFLFACHGVIETTFLLVNAGASLIFVCLIRLLIAMLITAVAARVIRDK